MPAIGDSRGRVLFPRAGTVLSGLATLVTVVIAIGVVILVGEAHHTPGSSTGATGARGVVVDRTGTVLVTNRTATDVQINPAALPPSHTDREAVYRRLARTLGLSTRPSPCRVVGRGVERLPRIDCYVAQHQRLSPGASVTVARDVAAGVARDLSEHQSELPGVGLKHLYVRSYPLRQFAAQLLGTVGPITAIETREPQYRGVPANEIVGQSGLESYYARRRPAGRSSRLTRSPARCSRWAPPRPLTRPSSPSR
jgi:cell division protein FtsI/penicillin-binding protein 2